MMTSLTINLHGPFIAVTNLVGSGREGAAKLRLAFLAVLVALVSASCVTQPVETQEWPSDMPPLSYFERIYNDDPANGEIQTRENYLKWVVRFYKGWELYQDGWHAITHDLLLSIDDAAGKERVGSKLSALGKKISGEWAKNSRDRAIRSRELSVWGQALVKSIDIGDEEELVNHVSRDVEALLSEKLRPAEITLRRYYDTTATGGAKDS